MMRDITLSKKRSTFQKAEKIKRDKKVHNKYSGEIMMILALKIDDLLGKNVLNICAKHSLLWDDLCDKKWSVSTLLGFSAKTEEKQGLRESTSKQREFLYLEKSH